MSYVSFLTFRRQNLYPIDKILGKSDLRRRMARWSDVGYRVLGCVPRVLNARIAMVSGWNSKALGRRCRKSNYRTP